MKYDRVLTIAALVAIPAVAIAQSNPANVDRGVAGKNLQRSHEDQQLPADVWHDTLWIVDDDVVDSGNGAAISGLSIFGVIYDLQLADDFECPGGSITSVTTDYLNFNGGGYAPATDLLMELYEDVGGAPAEVPHSMHTGSNYAASTINIYWWGPATRIICWCPNWYCDRMNCWVSSTPVDTTSSGDWYYAARKYGTGILGDAHGRDGGLAHGGLYGGPYGGGYGTDTWVSMGAMGYTAGDVSMQVTGTPGGGCGTFDLTITGDCNTNFDVVVSNGNPGARCAFAYSSDNTGTTPVPGCPGLDVCLTRAKAWSPDGLVIISLDNTGGWSFNKTGGPNFCGMYVQVVDLSNCEVSNVQVIP